MHVIRYCENSRHNEWKERQNRAHHIWWNIPLTSSLPVVPSGCAW